MNWDIPENDLYEEFVRSAAGPGGQHVNRTESTVRLHFKYLQCAALPEHVKQRLTTIAAPWIQDDEIVIQVRESRSLLRNREMARHRLITLLDAAAIIPKTRKKTKPTRASVERRLAGKSRRSEVKRNRGKVDY